MSGISSREGKIRTYCASFFVTCTILIVVFFIADIYPFGNRSLLIWDLRWQYTQFFTWYKKVLLEGGNLFYTFNAGMGTNMIGTYAYYLASPFNILVVFFEDIQLFIFIITILKLSCASVMCSFYLYKRFPQLENIWIVLFSVCYGTMSYSIAQKSNIMWLDGLIMLPLICCGVYCFVEQNKRCMLYMTVLITILANWYTAYMCCLFSVFYFFYELLLNNKKIFLKKIRLIVIYGITMLLAVLSSMAIFLPTIIDLLKGKGIESSTNYEFAWHCDFFTFIRGMFPGLWKEKLFGSESTAVLLFCGSFSIICLIGYFFSKRQSKKNRITSVIFLGFFFISACFIPFENIWNGFREANSYYCRFSFVISFFMLFLASAFLQNNSFRILRKKGVRLFILLFTIIELSYNAYSIVRAHAPFVSDKYREYNEIQKKQVDLINKSDTDFYRMEQASLYGERATDYLGVFNEGLAYNYHAFASYSSTFNAKIIDLYTKCGYHDYDKYIQYNEPILLTDSLWGIKYIISDHEILGCTVNDTLSIQDNKKVYENPYALGIGFCVKGSDIESLSAENAFEYQNSLISELLGRKIQCYKKVEYDKQIENDSVKYVLETPDNLNDHILYGYVKNVRNNENDADLYVNGELRTKYSRVTSYKMFQIDSSANNATVEVKGSITNEELLKGVFYYLDLKEFSKVIEELKNNSLNIDEIKDGYLKGYINVNENQQLFLSIPNDAGWKISCNGKSVKIDSSKTFITFEIEKGENTIEMVYCPSGLYAGIILAVISMLLFWMWYIIEKRIRETQK